MINRSYRHSVSRSATGSLGQPIALAAGLALGLSGASCGSPDFEKLPGPQAKDTPTASTAQPLLGADGAKVVAVLDTVINTYAKVTADVKPGDTQIKVANAALLTAKAGDLVMIIQMQGATIDKTDTAAYGSIGNVAGLGSAGKYELVGVSAVNVATNTVTLDVCAGGVKNAYSKDGHTQLVRVPQYTTLDVGLTSSVIAQPWNGDTGGVVAAYVQGKTTIGTTGAIDASASGFRGGASDNMTQASGNNVQSFRSADALDGAERGEGIAGSATEYDALYNGRYGRATGANGGGGGNSHNGGGGGGANGKAGAKVWTGAGVMVAPNNMFTAAWKLDPEYIAGNALTDSSGGGRGGYTFANSDQDATTLGPAQAAWGGNSRRDLGGFGGRPVDNDPAGRLFLGGGGGAGDGNNGGAGAGGNGGGLVYLVSSGGIEGGGTIASNGGNGARTKVGTVGNDAPGGGGAGGSIVVFSGRPVTNIKFNANGGTGGSQFIATDESEGPGGGGGGGYVALYAPQTTGITRTATGGISGTSNSSSVTEFNVNGATNGAVGQPDVAIPITASLPVCVPSDLSVTAVHTSGTVAAGQTVTLTVTVSNSGPQPANAATIADMLTAGLGAVTWTCANMGGAVCPAGSGTNRITSIDNIPSGGTLTFTIMVPIPGGFNGFPINYNVGANVPPGFNDPNLTNNSAALTLGNNQVPGADLTLNITATPNPSPPNAPIAYDLQLVNRGPGAAAGATMTFNVPTGGSAMLTTVPPGWQCGLAANVVTCSWNGQVPPGNLPNVIVTVTPPTGVTSVDTSGTATGRGVPDPDPSNNTVMNSVPIGNFPPADLSIGINSTPNPAPSGVDVVYDLRVTNAGPNAATGAALSFDVPGGSTVKNINAPSGWSCQQVSTTINCLYGSSVPTGSLPDVLITVTPDAATTALRASARVVGQGVADTNPANNTATETNPVGGTPPSADLVLTVTTAPNPPQANTPIIYTIDVANRGPGTATGAVLTYTVPEGGTIQSIDAPTGWNCGQQDRTISCWYNSDIPPDANAPDVVITVIPPTGVTSIDTPVSVTPKGATDPDLSNNQTTVTTQVIRGKLAGGGFSFGCSVAPTSGSAGSAGGGFLASLLGLLGLRRRRRQSRTS